MLMVRNGRDIFPNVRPSLNLTSSVRFDILRDSGAGMRAEGLEQARAQSAKIPIDPIQQRDRRPWYRKQTVDFVRDRGTQASKCPIAENSCPRSPSDRPQSTCHVQRQLARDPNRGIAAETKPHLAVISNLTLPKPTSSPKLTPQSALKTLLQSHAILNCLQSWHHSSLPPPAVLICRCLLDSRC